MPSPATNFFDQALVRATHEGSRRMRNRWMATGFVSALAAGMVFWMVSGILFNTPEIPSPNTGVPSIVMSIEEPRTVQLLFAADIALDNATLTVSLPSGIELAGFPGKREITWQTSLVAGKNRLPLKLVATSAVRGVVLATLTHENRGRTFRLNVDAGPVDIS